MKKYLIKVNGIPYEVEVEEVPDHSTEAIQPVKEVEEVAQRLVPASAPPRPEASAPKTDNSVPEGAKSITASMPGTIIKVNVSSGDNVKKGQVLLILEAMKMENEIVSPVDGTVVSVSVEKDKVVSVGDILVSLA